MFAGINIESSATCNLRCKMCPTATYGPSARKGYLKREIIERLLPLPEGVNGFDVDLTGWGEPLLNPDMPQILEALPGATFTTNASLMGSRWADRLIESGVSALAFSIDAAGQEMYMRQHGGGDSDQLWRNIELLRVKREKAGVEKPYMSAHFLLMKSNISELPQFIRKAAAAGLDDVVVKHVALFARSAQLKEALFTGFFDNHTVDETLRDRVVEEAKKEAESGGITFKKIGSDVARPVPECFGGALTRPFVAWDGKVSPCCVLAHEVSRAAPDGSVKTFPELFFGDINVEPLEQIWEKEDYAAHRNAIADGSPPKACENCLGVWSVTVEPIF